MRRCMCVYVDVCVCAASASLSVCVHVHMCEYRWIQDLRSLYYLISEKLCLWLNIYHVTVDGVTHCFCGGGGGEVKNK